MDTSETQLSVKAKLEKEIKLPSAALGLALSENDDFCHVTGMDRGVHQVNIDSGKTKRIGEHKSYAASVELLPDRQTLISAGYDGHIIWHDLAKKNVHRNIKAHNFWSWQMKISADGSKLASVTGQYICGGYKYEPAPETEPSVCVFDTKTGKSLAKFPHVPPVQSLAFSPDNRFLAAGNLMGEVRVWDLVKSQQVANWTTGAFTGWGIIKGHYYTGGIFDMFFSQESKDITLCGMGSTRDPAAGNGKQLWQKFDWQASPPKKLDESHSGEHGAGLMETLVQHPSGKYFVMAGRLFKGNWNVAFFDTTSGKLLHSFDCGMRCIKARFNAAGDKLFIAGAVSQKNDIKKKDKPNFGRIKIFTIT
ncbi:MAG: hypothetical protein CMO70_07195 [Verrucomicrobiales bacterium]|jgi:WD40 repeat protein|nr:hypothetical protein [Verrucomicrobiales bacterium]